MYNSNVEKRLRKSIIILCLLAIGIVIFISYFNRIPERIIPQGNTIVSPANGKVIHIESINNPEIKFFKNDVENILTIHQIKHPYTIIVIEMNLKNIHVQKAPIAGKIIYQEHFPGKHKNALSQNNSKELVNTNEKNLIVFKNNDLSVGVVQVAGLTARRIISFVNIGDEIKKGAIYGKIILGSQVVVILPQKANLTTKVGDILTDGESVIAEY